MRSLPIIAAIVVCGSVFSNTDYNKVSPNCPASFRAVSIKIRIGGYQQDIVVVRADGSTTGYARTNRGLAHFRSFPGTYPAKWYDVNDLKDDSVLDGAAGDGRFVTDLRAAGVTGEGFDIHVPDAAKQTRGNPVFESDFLSIKRPSNTYTVIYLHHGPFEYCTEPPQFYIGALKELSRVLKPGGVIRIAPISQPAVIYNALYEVPELEVVGRPAPDWTGGYYLEIRKR